jgi:hypothetical protein
MISYIVPRKKPTILIGIAIAKIYILKINKSIKLRKAEINNIQVICVQEIEVVLLSNTIPR